MSELITALATLQGDAKAMRAENPGVGFWSREHAPDVVYVIGPDGTQFGSAVLQEETLTDGSVVYHIELQS
jgi:hypothetical protein